MSAYVVEDGCINAVVTYIVHNRKMEWERKQIEEALSEQGVIGNTFEERLGNAMFELNCNAVDQRYGDNQAQEFRDLDYRFKADFYASGYGVYDRLGEWIYQCSEGDVPDNSRLYKAMREVYNGLAHRFFRDLRDSEEARRNDRKAS